MKTMSRIFAAVLALALCACLFAGCTAEKTVETTEVTTGGWTAAAPAAEAELDETAAAAFAAVADGYTPAALLCTQVVAGTNYCFLCGNEDGLQLVYVYNDLNGNASVTDTVSFNPADMME